MNSLNNSRDMILRKHHAFLNKNIFQSILEKNGREVFLSLSLSLSLSRIAIPREVKRMELFSEISSSSEEELE
jgi:hypothetical protein